jgi:opacity protein-like surface antigen
MELRQSLLLAPLAWSLVISSAAALEEPTFVDGQRVSIELGFGGGWPVNDTAYTRTLETFGFEHERSGQFRFSAAVEGIVLPYFSVLLQTNLLDKREWNRDSGSGPDDHFNWSSWTLDLHVRAFYPPVPWFRVYVQFGVGPTFVSSRLYVRTSTSGDQTKYEEVDVGYNVAGLAGFELSSTHVGFFAQGGYFYAPAPKNELGDRHQSGGGLLLMGISFHFGRPE